jgi:hypothetical protein
MSYKKYCPTCKEYFTAGRVDQRFCSVKCRNAHNNKIQSKINAPYQLISKNLKEQDEHLRSLSKNPNQLFHSEHFKSNGIIIDQAFRFKYDQLKQLESIVFVKYQLIHVGNSLFKISKI